MNKKTVPLLIIIASFIVIVAMVPQMMTSQRTLEAARAVTKAAVKEPITRAEHVAIETTPDPLLEKYKDYDQDIVKFAIKEAYEKSLDPALVLAVGKVESNLTANIRSRTGDSGVMQINDINKGWLAEAGITDLMDYKQNITAGCIILKGLQDKGYDTKRMLLSYNCGETGARRLIAKDVHETSYTKKVIKEIER